MLFLEELVLTNDYEHIDFVLLERILPELTSTSSGPFVERQATIRPRVLSVQHRKPTRVELRVLRRFTYTEIDPFAQYDKLLSAFAIGDWSGKQFKPFPSPLPW